MHVYRTSLIYIKLSKLVLNLSIHENQYRLNQKPKTDKHENENKGVYCELKHITLSSLYKWI